MNQRLEVVLDGKGGEERISFYGEEGRQIEFGRIMEKVMEFVNLYYSYNGKMPNVRNVNYFIEREEPESKFSLFVGTPYSNIRKIYVKSEIIPTVLRGRFYNVVDEHLAKIKNPHIIKYSIMEDLRKNYPLNKWGENVPIEGAVNIFLKRLEVIF